MSAASLMRSAKGFSPLAGYTEEEMVAEARARIAENKKNRRLKQLLSAASEDGSTVATKDLLLAAKLAKMDLPEAMIADTPFATGVDAVGKHSSFASFFFGDRIDARGARERRTRGRAVRLVALKHAVVRRVPPPLSRTHTCMRFYLHARTPPRFHQPILRFFSRLLPTSSLPGCPTKIQWKPFYNNLPPPPLRGPGGFAPEELPILRKNKPIEVESADGGIDITTLADMNAGPKDEEVSYWFKILQEKMTTRFGELRRAFRTLDEDASGSLDRDEFKNVLVMFNLGIPPPIIEKIIDLADYDGDGTINYAEFARIVTTEDIFKMKNTLSAVEDGGAHAAKVRYQMAQGGKGKLDKETGENVRLRRTGPGLEKMRKAHRTLRNLILNRYPSMKACFSAIDADGSGLVRRAELRSFMSKLSKSIPDGVISGLIAYVDTDGDTKTLSEEEFCRMMSEEFLDTL